MKNSYVYILLFFFGLVGCKNSEDRIVNSEDRIVLTLHYSKEDLIEVNLPLLEVKEKLHPILDSLIVSINNCERYQNLPLGFVFYTQQDSASERLLLHIENVSKLQEVNYKIYDGIFYYKGYQFSLSGVIIPDLFRELDQKVKLFSIKEEKLLNMYDEYGEFFYSMWVYVYDKSNFECIGYSRCGNEWHVDNYPAGNWY